MSIDVLYLVTIILVVLISMTLHEMAHAYVAFWLGDYTPKAQGRLSPNPLKHIDPFMTLIMPVALAVAGLPIFGGAKPVQINPLKIRYHEWGMALIAICGPLTNLIIAFLSFVFLYYLGVQMSPFWFDTLLVVVHVNLGFFVFNLIPIPPLDGSRVVYALAPEPVQRGMEWIERFGIVFVFVVVMMLSPYISTFVGGAVNGVLDVFQKLMI